MRSFWDDWVDTARDRDRLACRCHEGICQPQNFRGPHHCSVSGYFARPIAPLSLLHVRDHLPRRHDSDMVDALALTMTPRSRWAPERWSLAWKPPALRYRSHFSNNPLLRFRVLSYVTVN